MSIDQDAITFILGVFAVGGTIFGIFSYFRKPQEQLEKDQILTNENIKDRATILSQKEIEGKAELLAKQVQWDKEAIARQFTEMQTGFYKLLELNQNHLHTIETKLDTHIQDNTVNNLEVAKILSRLETKQDLLIKK